MAGISESNNYFILTILSPDKDKDTTLAVKIVFEELEKAGIECEMIRLCEGFIILSS